MTTSATLSHAQAVGTLEDFLGCKIGEHRRAEHLAGRLWGYVRAMDAAGRPDPADDLRVAAVNGIAGLLEIGDVEATVAEVRDHHFDRVCATLEQNAELHDLCANHAKAGCIRLVARIVGA